MSLRDIGEAVAEEANQAAGKLAQNSGRKIVCAKSKTMDLRDLRGYLNREGLVISKRIRIGDNGRGRLIVEIEALPKQPIDGTGRSLG